MNEHTRRKMRKLMRDPKQFFLDAKLLGAVVRFLFDHPLHPFLAQKPSLQALELPQRLSTLAPDENLTALMDETGIESLIFFWQVPEELKVLLRQNMRESFIVYINQTPKTIQAIESFLTRHQLPSHRAFFSSFPNNEKTVPAEIQDLSIATGVPIKDFFPDGTSSLYSHYFYFPVQSESTLLSLLNTADISDSSLLQPIPNLLRLMQDLRVGPWPDYACNILKNFTTATQSSYVLFIGDHDLSSEESRARELATVQAVREENHDADVIYIPCPTQNKYLLTKKDFVEDLRQYSIPVIATVSMADAILGAQRVYTRRSPGALFALLYAVPVSLFESTFFAGWGLTDDRFSCEERMRTLSMEEFFYIFFILYQKYECISNDTTINFIVYLLRISGDRYGKSIALYSDKYCQKSPHIVAQTEFWPLLLSKKNLPVLLNKFPQKLATILPIKNLLENVHDDDARFVLSFLFAGIIRHTPAWKDFIYTLRNCLPLSQLREIFQIWNSMISSQALVDNLISICEKQGDIGYIRQMLHDMLEDKSYSSATSDYTLFSHKKYNYALRLATFEVRERNLENAFKILLSLLFSGYYTEDVLYHIALVSKYRFHFSTAKLLAQILIMAFPVWRTNIVTALYIDVSVTNNIADTLPILVNAIESGTEAPNITYLQRKLASTYGEYPWQKIFSSIVKNGSPIAKANTCLLGGEYKQAYQYLHDATPNQSEIKDYFKAFTQYFILSCNFKEAEAFLDHMSCKIPAALFYSKYIEILLNEKAYSKAKKLYKKCLDEKIEIMPHIKYRMQYILQDFHGALETIGIMTSNKVFMNVMGHRALACLEDIDSKSVRSLLVLIESGPGDEIRGASHYRQIAQHTGVERIVFTCDERLYKLFERSFPDLTFHPFQRFRHYSYITDLSLFSRVPSSELVWMMDNSVWDAAQTFDKVIRYFSARVSVVKSYADIAGTPFLKADPELSTKLRSRLKKEQKLLVGLCWRSSLQNGVRNAAFFSPEELAPLLELENVQFINCQSDGCTEKEKRFFENYPGKFIDIADIDQYNNFAEAAALYSALDVMISCPNTVMELAGALGVPTLTFTLTYEPDLHLRPNCDRNVYYNSVIHIGHNISIHNRKEVIFKLKNAIQHIADM